LHACRSTLEDPLNEERNILTITASPELVERILDDIMKIDRKPRQVSLEAIVVEVSSEGRKSLGIDWSGQSGKFSGSMENLDVTFTYISTPSITRQITSKIHALVEDGLAQIKATPRVTTMDGEEASINIGLEQYISLVTGPVTYPYVKLETIKAGVTLNILPLISEDNTILVKIKPAEVSDFIETGKDGLPIINKRSVATTVMVKNQETIVIGGLIRKREIEKVSRIPVLGYIPILNLIFSKREKIVEDSEVLILITPRIIDISS
jgi:Type II secretory pathway, component PulD